MSDFIYSNSQLEHGLLTKAIKAIYHDYCPQISEFHGKWGSLAISRNLYNGFQPYETDDYIFAVVGGPVLYFESNDFLKDELSNAGTKLIFKRWYEGKLIWDKDLSGPFAIIIINKNSSDIQVVTDLMSFIPIYSYQNTTQKIFSTHVDVLANVSKQTEKIDIISCADFILHSVVTFPYTMYENIYQMKPASVYRIKGNKIESQAYWLPIEKNQYSSIKEAAVKLRIGLYRYVKSITNEVNDIAQFISGGEDSRVLTGLLQDNSRDAFIFLDKMNREGKLAEKAAHAYEANFKMATRTKTYYLKILPHCSDLVGSGSQYHHAHTYGFHKSCKLNKYSAVFGGLLSDALLKGSHIKKIRSSSRFPFLPQIKTFDHSAETPIVNKIISSKVLYAITERRQAHIEYIKTFRNESVEEWFELWPSSMNMNIPNIHANRRLFKSYEPFTANDVVKISASVPQNWKLNRKLFNIATKPILRPTKWLFHGDGRLPYFPWYINFFVQMFVWVYRQFGRRVGMIKGNQGPWGEWDVVMQSDEWKNMIIRYSKGFDKISSLFNEKDIEKIFNDCSLNKFQKINLMQVLYERMRNTKYD